MDCVEAGGATLFVGAIAALVAALERWIMGRARRSAERAIQVERAKAQARIEKAEAEIDRETDAEVQRIERDHPKVEQPTEADARRLLTRMRMRRGPRP